MKRLTIPQKKTFNYAEASSEKQKEFLEEIQKIDPEDIVYSDETGIDDNEVLPTGWSPRGERCNAQKNAERKTRYNIIAALNQKTLFAPFLFEYTMNAAIYETYIEHVLVPQLRPGMVVVIDNASTHKSKRTMNLILAAGCRILFLPPYSPQLNPIEHHWSAIKTKIRKAADTCKDFLTASIKTLAEACGA